MKPEQLLSLDDHLIQIHRQLQKVNAHVTDRRWPSALAGLDHIVEHANLAFDIIGAMDAQSAKAGSESR
jgi:hypothetical protein